jgi:hypothetical protein
MNRFVEALPLLVLGAMGLCGSAGAALAGPREDVRLASERCDSIADEHKWLDCYYGAAQPVRAQLGLPPAPAGQIALVPPAGSYVPPPALAALPSERPAYGVGAVRPAPGVSSGPPPMPHYQGGLYSGVFGTGKQLVSNLRMTSYDFNANGYFIVTLFDGEVWQQLANADEPRAHWKKPASSYVVSVAQGSLGTYNLLVDGEGDSYKVRRIK